jgi:mycothiol synthase
VIEVRLSASADEDARSLDIFNAVCPRYAFAPEDADGFKRAMIDADDYLAFADRDLAGSAFVAIRPARPEVAFALITVVGASRRRGIGTALYDVVSRWSAERRLAAIESFVDDDDAIALAFATKRGFRPINHYGGLELDLTSLEPPDVAAPPGVVITAAGADEELLRAIYDVDIEAVPDEPGNEDAVPEPFESWLESELRAYGRKAQTRFVAIAGDEVVGYATLAFTAARPGVARHSFIAIKRDWRRRGIASALKRAQIAWAKAAGFDWLVAQNESRNVPILRINDRLGYRPAPGRLLVRGPLSAAV